MGFSFANKKNSLSFLKPFLHLFYYRLKYQYLANKRKIHKWLLSLGTFASVFLFTFAAQSLFVSQSAFQANLSDSVTNILQSDVQCSENKDSLIPLSGGSGVYKLALENASGNFFKEDCSTALADLNSVQESQVCFQTSSGPFKVSDNAAILVSDAKNSEVTQRVPINVGYPCLESMRLCEGKESNGSCKAFSNLNMSVGEKRSIPFAELTFANKADNKVLVPTSTPGLSFEVSSSNGEVAGTISNGEFTPKTLGNISVLTKFANSKILSGKESFASSPLVFSVNQANCTEADNQIYANDRAFIVDDISALPQPAHYSHSPNKDNFSISGKTQEEVSYFFAFDYDAAAESTIIESETAASKQIRIRYSGDTASAQVSSIIKQFNALSGSYRPLVLNKTKESEITFTTMETGEIQNDNWQFNSQSGTFSGATGTRGSITENLQAFPENLTEGEMYVAYYPGSDLHGKWSAANSRIDDNGKGVIKLIPYTGTVVSENSISSEQNPSLPDYDSPFVIIQAQTHGNSVLSVQGNACAVSKSIQVKEKQIEVVDESGVRITETNLAVGESINLNARYTDANNSAVKNLEWKSSVDSSIVSVDSGVVTVQSALNNKEVFIWAESNESGILKESVNKIKILVAGFAVNGSNVGFNFSVAKNSEIFLSSTLGSQPANNTQWSVTQAVEGCSGTSTAAEFQCTPTQASSAVLEIIALDPQSSEEIKIKITVIEGGVISMSIQDAPQLTVSGQHQMILALELNDGEGQRLSVDNNYFIDHPITWESSHSSVADISSGGMLLAQKSGTTQVSAVLNIEGRDVMVFSKPISVISGFSVNGISSEQFSFSIPRNTEIKLTAFKGNIEAEDTQWNVEKGLSGCAGTVTGKAFSCTPTEAGSEDLVIRATSQSTQDSIQVSITVEELGITSINIQDIPGQFVGSEHQAIMSLALDDGSGERLSNSDSFFAEHPITWKSSNSNVLEISPNGGLINAKLPGFAQVSGSIEFDGKTLEVFSSSIPVVSGFTVNGFSDKFSYSVARNSEVRLTALKAGQEAANTQWSVINSITGCSGNSSGKEFVCTPTTITQGDKFLQISATDPSTAETINISIVVAEAGIESLSIQPISSMAVSAQQQAVMSLTLDDGKGERLSTSDSFFADHPITWVSIHPDIISIKKEGGGIFKAEKSGFGQIAASVSIAGKNLVVFSSQIEVQGLSVNGNRQEFSFTSSRNAEIKLAAKVGSSDANTIQWTVLNGVSGCNKNISGTEFTCTPTQVSSTPLEIQALNPETQEKIQVTVAVVESGLTSLSIQSIPSLSKGTEYQVVLALELDDGAGERLSTNDAFFSDHLITWQSSSDALSISSGGLLIANKIGVGQISATIKIDGKNVSVFSEPIQVLPGFSINSHVQGFALSVARNSLISLHAKVGSADADLTEWTVLNSVQGCTGTQSGKEFSCTPTEVSSTPLEIQALNPETQESILVSANVLEVGIVSMAIDAIPSLIPQQEHQLVLRLTMNDGQGERLSTNNTFFTDHPVEWLSLAPSTVAVSSGGVLIAQSKGTAQVSATINIGGEDIRVFSPAVSVLPGLSVNGHSQNFSFTHARNSEIQLSSQVGNSSSSNIQWSVLNAVEGCTGTQSSESFSCTPTETSFNPLQIRVLNSDTQENILVSIDIVEVGLKSMSIENIPKLAVQGEHQLVLKLELDDGQGERFSDSDNYFSENPIVWSSSSSILSVSTGGLLVAQNPGKAQVSATMNIKGKGLQVFSAPIEVMQGFNINGSTQNLNFSHARNSEIKLSAKLGELSAPNTEWTVVQSVEGCTGTVTGSDFTCTPRETSNANPLKIQALDPDTQEIILVSVNVEELGVISASIENIPGLIPGQEHQLIFKLELDDGQGERLSTNNSFFSDHLVSWTNLSSQAISLSSGGVIVANKKGVAQVSATISIGGKNIQVFSNPIEVLSGFQVNGSTQSFSYSVARNTEVKLHALIGNNDATTTQWTVLNSTDGCLGSVNSAEFTCTPKSTTAENSPLLIRALDSETQASINISVEVVESGIDSIRIQEVSGANTGNVTQDLVMGDHKQLSVGVVFNGSSQEVFSHNNSYLQSEGIEFSSTNPSVLQVGSGGLIQAVGPGVAQIEVTFTPPESQSDLGADLFSNILRRPVKTTSDPIQVNPGLVVNGRIADFNMEVFVNDTKDFSVSSPAGNATITGDSTLAGSSMTFDSARNVWVYRAPAAIEEDLVNDELVFNTNQIFNRADGQTSTVKIRVQVKVIKQRVESLQILRETTPSNVGVVETASLKKGEILPLKLRVKLVNDPTRYEWGSGQDTPAKLSQLGLPEWLVDNSNILSVDSGLIKGLKVGDTTLTVSFGSAKAILNVSVEEGFLVNNLPGSQEITTLTGSVQDFITSAEAVTWSVIQNESKGFNVSKTTTASDLVYQYTAGDKEGLDILQAKNSDEYSILVTIRVVKSAIEILSITDPTNPTNPNFSMKEGETKAFGVDMKFVGNPTVFKYDGVNEQPNLFDASTVSFSSLTPGILESIGGGSFRALNTGMGQIRLEMGSGTEFGNIVVTKFIDVQPGFMINGHKNDFSVNVFPGKNYEFNISGIDTPSGSNPEYNFFPSTTGGNGTAMTLSTYTYSAPNVLGAAQNIDQLKVRNSLTNEEILITIHTIPPQIEQVMIVRADQNPILNFNVPVVTEADPSNFQFSSYDALNDTPNLQENDVVTLTINQKSVSTQALTGADLARQAVLQLEQLGGAFSEVRLLSSFNSPTLYIDARAINTPFDAKISITQKGILKVSEEEAIALKLVALMQDGSIETREAGQLSHPIFANPTWAVDKEDIVAMSESGQVRGLKAGFATVAVVVGSSSVDENGNIISLTPTYYADIEVTPAFAINGVYDPDELKKFEIFAGGTIDFNATKNGAPALVSWSVMQNQSGSSNVNTVGVSNYPYIAGVKSDIAGSIMDIIQVTDGNGKIHNIEIKVIPPTLEQILLRRTPAVAPAVLTDLHAGNIMQDLELQYQLSGGILETIILGTTTVPSVLGDLTWTSSDDAIARVDNGIVTFTGEGDVTLSVSSSLDPNNTASIALEVNPKQAEFIPNSTRVTPSFPATDALIHIETELYFQDGIENIQEVNIQFDSPYLQDAKLLLEESYRKQLESRIGIAPLLESGEDSTDAALEEVPGSGMKQAKYEFDYQLPGEQALDGKVIVYTLTAVTRDGARSSLDTQSISQVGTITVGSVQDICSPNKKLQCLIRGLKCLKEKSANNVSEECDQVISVFTNDPESFSILDVFKKYKELRK